ncbi:unnamed protein product [Caenorhabditis bovis]|uniref:Uncharacterized protein n=1 Tax=Caenorhabditis bovis TaxID=2654633 RepID=A0A8S1FFX3_9PELO|nr:unnamed protein product [Caenorhabditis bovis]
MLQAELTETTTEDKVRRLVSFFTSTPYEDIGLDFDLTSGIDKADPDYFFTMMTDAINMHFGVAAEQDQVSESKTVQDLVDIINSNNV